MTGSSPAGSTVQTQNVTPSQFTQTGLNNATSLYNNNPTYAGMNDVQRRALQQIQDISGSPDTTLNSAQDFSQRAAGGQYLNSNPANGMLSMIGGNGMNSDLFQGNLNRLGTASGTNPAMAMLTKTAQGGYLDPATNPYLTGTFNRGFDAVRGAVGSAMAGAGRFGSGAMAGALTSGGTNLANEIYGNNYQQERERMQAAQGTIGQLYDTGVGLGISANTNAGQLREGDARNMLGALGQQSTNYNTGLDVASRAAALAPSLSAARYNNSQEALNAGNVWQADAQKWADEPYQRLSRYMNFSNPSGSTTSASSPYFNNPTGNALTGATGVGSLLASLFGGSGKDGAGPSAASNIGSALSGAWGGLSNLFGGGGGGSVPLGGSIYGNTAASGTYGGTYGQDAYNQLFGG